MVKITPELLRKRAEHNDMELSTLEELSLHQLNIDKIDHLGRWCPLLKILLLQGNLISKIENVNRLKQLEYLNLALNNIETISGLENCESLRKLDLTANFITDLQSAQSLRGLSQFTELYLTGNPCTKYRGYRCWLVTHLPNLQELDGVEILQSERIKSRSNKEADKLVQKDEEESMEKRKTQRESFSKEKKEKKFYGDESEDVERWGEEITGDSPELRTAMNEEIQRRRQKHEEIANGKQEKLEPRFFSAEGRPLNMNKANLEFTFTDDEEKNEFVLEVKTFRFLSGEHLKCDVQPNYVRVTVKELPLQIVYPSPVRACNATARRSQVTGHLTVTAPKVDESKMMRFSSKKKNDKEKEKKDEKIQSQKKITNQDTTNDSIYLETENTNPEDRWRICSPTESESESKCNWQPNVSSPIPERPNSSDFVDDPSVPPLE